MSDETPYTPSTTMVRLSYIASTKDDGDPDWTREGAKAEFTRWLDGEKAKAVADAQAQKAQIATQEPAGETQGGSAGRGVPGGLGERLRALIPDRTMHGEDGYFGVTALEIREFADDADELEAAYRVADAEIARLSVFHDHYRAQVEAIRAAITREAAHGEAITRCNLVAERFQTVLDSVTAP